MSSSATKLTFALAVGTLLGVHYLRTLASEPDSPPPSDDHDGPPILPEEPKSPSKVWFSPDSPLHELQSELDPDKEPQLPGERFMNNGASEEMPGELVISAELLTLSHSVVGDLPSFPGKSSHGNSVHASKQSSNHGSRHSSLPGSRQSSKPGSGQATPEESVESIPSPKTLLDALLLSRSPSPLSEDDWVDAGSRSADSVDHSAAPQTPPPSPMGSRSGDFFLHSFYSTDIHESEDEGRLEMETCLLLGRGVAIRLQRVFGRELWQLTSITCSETSTIFMHENAFSDSPANAFLNDMRGIDRCARLIRFANKSPLIRRAKGACPNLQSPGNSAKIFFPEEVEAELLGDTVCLVRSGDLEMKIFGPGDRAGQVSLICKAGASPVYQSLMPYELPRNDVVEFGFSDDFFTWCDRYTNSNFMDLPTLCSSIEDALWKVLGFFDESGVLTGCALNAESEIVGSRVLVGFKMGGSDGLLPGKGAAHERPKIVSPNPRYGSAFFGSLLRALAPSPKSSEISSVSMTLQCAADKSPRSLALLVGPFAEKFPVFHEQFKVRDALGRRYGGCLALRELVRFSEIC